MIYCGPRHLSEIGGSWQQTSLHLGCEERSACKVTPQLMQEGASFCLLLSSVPSLNPGPQAGHGTHLAMAFSRTVIAQGTVFKEHYCGSVLHMKLVMLWKVTPSVVCLLFLFFFSKEKIILLIEYSLLIRYHYLKVEGYNISRKRSTLE